MADERDMYAETGVDYSKLDPFKVNAMTQCLSTFDGIIDTGFSVVPASMGESALVFDTPYFYLATTIEGIGSKPTIAQAVADRANKLMVAAELAKSPQCDYFKSIGIDNAATIFNDLATVGARPINFSMFLAVSNADWFHDMNRYEALFHGTAQACRESGAAWGQGETQILAGNVYNFPIVLAGSALGVIAPKNRLILGEKLAAGDHILLVESSGIHTNGLSLARKIKEDLPEGYDTKLSDGQPYGDALLTPSFIYAKLIQDLLNQGVDIHYLAHITGHGWSKLMRANKDFTYLINQVPSPQPIFDFIQQQAELTDKEMYHTFNMGAGYAIFLAKDHVELAQQVTSQNGLKSWDGGVVEEGPKQVVIKPVGLVFDQLSIR